MFSGILQSNLAWELVQGANSLGNYCGCDSECVVYDRYIILLLQAFPARRPTWAIITYTIYKNKFSKFGMLSEEHLLYTVYK